MKTNYHWLIFAATNMVLLALTAMVNDGLAGWSLTLFIAGPCVILPTLILPLTELFGCLILTGLAADAQLPTPPGFLMCLFVTGAVAILLIRPWLGQAGRMRQIILAWLLNGLYFIAFTAWALTRNQAGGMAFWEHVAGDFCLSQIIVLPIALWFFDFQKCVLTLAGLTAPPRRAEDAF